MKAFRTIGTEGILSEPTRLGRLSKKQLLLSCVCAGLLSICASARSTPTAPPTPASDDNKTDNKIELRNNAASLLADLLGQEKDVSKILIIKHPSAATEKLIKAISKTAEEGSAQLETLAKDDKTLNLHALQLPPGETATREAVSKTEEHELILTFGTTFELNLLLTQTQALNYASHLAKIAADNSKSEQQHDFHALDVSLDNLYKEVVARIRAMPRK